jgi:hypothetical protein
MPSFRRDEPDQVQWVAVLGLAPPLSPKAPHGERRVGGGERGVKGDIKAVYQCISISYIILCLLQR